MKKYKYFLALSALTLTLAACSDEKGEGKETGKEVETANEANKQVDATKSNNDINGIYKDVNSQNLTAKDAVSDKSADISQIPSDELYTDVSPPAAIGKGIASSQLMEIEGFKAQVVDLRQVEGDSYEVDVWVGNTNKFFLYEDFTLAPFFNGSIIRDNNAKMHNFTLASGKADTFTIPMNFKNEGHIDLAVAITVGIDYANYQTIQLNFTLEK